MSIIVKPHSEEWFEALRNFNPQQAAHTQQIVIAAGKDFVCSICGDEDCADYKLRGDLAEDAVATVRLCDDCKVMQNLDVEPFDS